MTNSSNKRGASPLKDETIEKLQARIVALEHENARLQTIVAEDRECEARLRQAKTLYRTIAHFAYDWVYWQAPDGSLRYVSPSCERITGYTPDEFMANPALFADIIFQDDSAIWSKHRHEANITQEQEIQIRILRRDGAICWIEHICQPVIDKDGTFSGFRVNNRDISRRKQAERDLERYREQLEEVVAARTAELTRINQALEQEIAERVRVEERLKEQDYIISKSPVMVFLWRNDQGWPVEYISHNIHEFGYIPQDFYTERVLFTDIVHPDDRQRLAAEVAEYGRDGRSGFMQEYRIITHSGQVRWVENRTWVRRNEHNEITHFQGVVYDITSRKEVEIALQESEETARALLNASTDHALLVEPDGTIIALNQNQAMSLGQNADQVIGRNVFDFFSPDVAQARRDWMHVVVQSGQPARFEDTRAGRWYNNHFYPVFDAKGQVKRVAVYASDITEIRQAELAIRQANDELQQHIEELSTLNLIAQTVTTITDLETVLGVVSGTLSQLFDAYGTEISLLAGSETRLTISVCHNEDGTSETKTTPLVPLTGNPAAQRVIETGQPLLVLKAQTNPLTEPIHKILRAQNIQSLMSVPMLSRGKTIGLITIYADQSHRDFTPVDVGLAETIAGQVAGAVETARLFAQEQERRQEAERRRLIAESLGDILAVINSNRPLADTLDYIVVQANSLLDTDASAIYRQEETAAELFSVLAAQGYCAEALSGVELPLGHSALQQALSSGQPLAFSDLLVVLADDTRRAEAGSPVRAELAELIKEFKALLAIPLFVKDEPYGGIILYYRNPRNFSAEEIALAVIFSYQVTLAIENAGLRLQAERSAVAAERNRLARDLHDSVTQTLFSVAAIAEALPRVWDSHPAESKKALGELRRLTQGALAEMRNLLLELRPAALVEKPMSELLRQLTDAMMGRTRMLVTTTVVDERALPPDVKIGLYRIAQESLNNVTKHARASQVKIGLYYEPQQVELNIIDNGYGFDPGTIAPGQLGVGIMAERAAAINAAFEINSQPEKGTQITVVWSES